MSSSDHVLFFITVGFNPAKRWTGMKGWWRGHEGTLQGWYGVIEEDLFVKCSRVTDAPQAVEEF